MGTFITICILCFISYKVYPYFLYVFTTPSGTNAAQLLEDQARLFEDIACGYAPTTARQIPQEPDYIRNHRKKEERLQHAIDVLRTARETASQKYTEALLKGTPTKQHFVEFERDWKRAKEAVRAKYGKSTVEDALRELDLDYE